MRDLVLLASGPSVREYNLRGLETRGHLVGVSGSAMYAKVAVALTMDRLVAEYCYPIWKIQGVPDIWIRRSEARNLGVLHSNVHLFANSNAKHALMTMEADTLNGDNSGMCALNYALQRRPERVFLLGFDMARIAPKDSPYWHPAYPWNPAGGSTDRRLAEWAEEFQLASTAFKAFGIEVYNVNHRSRITAFPVISFKDFLEMTK